jgi:hypothetical protein
VTAELLPQNSPRDSSDNIPAVPDAMNHKWVNFIQGHSQCPWHSGLKRLSRMAGAIDLGRLANFETITSAKRELPQSCAMLGFQTG